MSTTAVEKGLQFEQAVVDMLNKCGFKAWRTNQSNEVGILNKITNFLLENRFMIHIIRRRRIRKGSAFTPD